MKKHKLTYMELEEFKKILEKPNLMGYCLFDRLDWNNIIQESQIYAKDNREAHFKLLTKLPSETLIAVSYKNFFNLPGLEDAKRFMARKPNIETEEGENSNEQEVYQIWDIKEPYSSLLIFTKVKKLKKHMQDGAN